MPKANRKYKDSVFTMYFNDPVRLIELYNSLEGTNLPLDTPIEINTLDDALFKDRINDISFVINGVLIVLIEHQSTWNENMPVRLLIYIARVYEKILEKENIYRSTRIPLPAPRFVVLYNGEEKNVDYVEMKLSDAFILREKNPMLDLKVDFFNINYGKSSEIMEKCKSLSEYSTFVFYVRENRKKGMPLAEAIASAVKQAIRNDIMKDFLTKHGSEVENMLFEEWDWEAYVAVQKEESHEQGIKEGIEKGASEMLSQVVHSMVRTMMPEDIAAALSLPLPQVLNILSTTIG